MHVANVVGSRGMAHRGGGEGGTQLFIEVGVFLQVALQRWARADEVAIAVDVVNAANSRPKFVGPQAGQGINSLLARVRAVPAITDDHISSVWSALQHIVLREEQEEGGWSERYRGATLGKVRAVCLTSLSTFPSMTSWISWRMEIMDSQKRSISLRSSLSVGSTCNGTGAFKKRGKQQNSEGHTV